MRPPAAWGGLERLQLAGTQLAVEKFQTQMHSAYDRRCARGDAFDVAAAKPDAVRVAESSIEPGCEEGVAHRWRRMRLEQGAGGG